MEKYFTSMELYEYVCSGAAWLIDRCPGQTAILPPPKKSQEMPDAPLSPPFCRPLLIVSQSGPPLSPPAHSMLLCERCCSFYNLTSDGCSECICDVHGTVMTSSSSSSSSSFRCDKVTGGCQCRSNTQGRRCDTCRPGMYSSISIALQ